ncbi:hypothetical protein SEA_YEEZY_53 [Gordonia phage Yeezy]|uniref:Uncharacterized protein n=1 Tax=Gordonia phage Yeezy TaxID=1821565 RepID=A0A142K9L5_9CAUD|nr:hypothetical protein SEA_YEEZY_53 [Gordonia phage Yeezy]AMS02798.1 hypothetical protein SEA_YEEZY_53 [Gordonia phage Yeezy]
MSGAFPAKFPGWCKHPDCGQRIAVDDEVAFHPVHRGDPEAVLMHVECARGKPNADAEDIELRRGETICPDCHLVHRGECL